MACMSPRNSLGCTVRTRKSKGSWIEGWSCNSICKQLETKRQVTEGSSNETYLERTMDQSIQYCTQCTLYWRGNAPGLCYCNEQCKSLAHVTETKNKNAHNEHGAHDGSAYPELHFEQADEEIQLPCERLSQCAIHESAGT